MSGLAEVLADHPFDGITVEPKGYWVGCRCGDRRWVETIDGTTDYELEHRYHLADVALSWFGGEFARWADAVLSQTEDA